MTDEENSEKDEQISFRLSNRLDREIIEWGEQHGCSRSEAARKLIKRGLDYDDKIDEIEARISDLEIDLQKLGRRTSELESEESGMVTSVTDKEQMGEEDLAWLDNSEWDQDFKE